MSKSRLFIFAYDISSSSRRRAVAKRLETEGIRVQGSVFEIRTTHAHASQLGESLRKSLDRGDSLRVYFVPDLALKHSTSYGGAPLPEPGNWLMF